MNSSVKFDSIVAAAEVWVNTTNDMQWQLVEACYGDHPQLRSQSSIRTYDAGILDRVSAERRPLLIADLNDEYLARGIQAPDDIPVVLAMPCFDRGSITSILMLFFKLSDHAKGAAEIWCGREGTHELSMLDGHYAGLDQFAEISKYVHLPYGSGLPGRAWQYGSCQLMTSINQAQSFLRSSSADSDGLHTGIAIPVIDYHNITGIVTLLSSAETPIARAYEIWKPNVVGNSPALVKISAHYGKNANLAKISTRLSVQPGEGLIGNAWSARRPIILSELQDENFMRKDAALADGLSVAIAIPSMLGDVVNSILVILW